MAPGTSGHEELKLMGTIGLMIQWHVGSPSWGFVVNLPQLFPASNIFYCKLLRFLVFMNRATSPPLKPPIRLYCPLKNTGLHDIECISVIHSSFISSLHANLATAVNPWGRCHWSAWMPKRWGTMQLLIITSRSSKWNSYGKRIEIKHGYRPCGLGAGMWIW